MRCSECSKVVRPVVAVDIDGTLADYHGHFLKFASHYLMQWFPRSDYDGTCSFREWFCEMAEVDERTWRDIKLAYRQGGQKRSVSVYPWAAELIECIRGADAELWLTTTRPYLRLDGVDPDTRFWLDFRNIKYDGLLYDEDKYAVLAERVEPGRVAAVLDDLPEMYDAASEQFGHTVPILRRTHYNRAVERPSYASNLQQAWNFIEDNLEAWKVKNAG